MIYLFTCWLFIYFKLKGWLSVTIKCLSWPTMRGMLGCTALNQVYFFTYGFPRAGTSRRAVSPSTTSYEAGERLENSGLSDKENAVKMRATTCCGEIDLQTHIGRWVWSFLLHSCQGWLDLPPHRWSWRRCLWRWLAGLHLWGRLGSALHHQTCPLSLTWCDPLSQNHSWTRSFLLRDASFPQHS